MSLYREYVLFIAVLLFITSAVIVDSKDADQCSSEDDRDGQCMVPPPDEVPKNTKSKTTTRQHGNMKIKRTIQEGVTVEESTDQMTQEQFDRLLPKSGPGMNMKTKEDVINLGKNEDELDESWQNAKSPKIKDLKIKQQKSKKTRTKLKKGDDGKSGNIPDITDKEKEERMANLRREVEELEKIERELRAKGHFKDADGNPQKERVCPTHLFECGSKECILPTSKCDNEEDCADGSDEVGCPKGGDPLWKCPHNLFTCKNKECILQHYRCDGRNNCSDGSDERNCDDATIAEKKKWNAKFAKLNQGKRRRPSWDEL